MLAAPIKPRRSCMPLEVDLTKPVIDDAAAEVELGALRIHSSPFVGTRDRQ